MSTATPETHPELPWGKTDLYGRPFNAKKFRPEKDILGRWKNLRGGRRPLRELFKRKKTMQTATEKTPEPAPSAPVPAAAPETAKPANAEVVDAAELNGPEPKPAEKVSADDAGAARTESEGPKSNSFVPPGDVQPEGAATERMTPERQAAEGVCVMFYTVGAIFVGEDEWIPKKGEHEPLREAWESYFRATGAKQLPAWAAPALAMAVFAQKRLSMPKTQTTIGKIKLWLFNRRARKAGEKISDKIHEVESQK